MQITVILCTWYIRLSKQKIGEMYFVTTTYVYYIDSKGCEIEIRQAGWGGWFMSYFKGVN